MLLQTAKTRATATLLWGPTRFSAVMLHLKYVIERQLFIVHQLILPPRLWLILHHSHHLGKSAWSSNPELHFCFFTRTVFQHILHNSFKDKLVLMWQIIPDMQKRTLTAKKSFFEKQNMLTTGECKLYVGSHCQNCVWLARSMGQLTYWLILPHFSLPAEEPQASEVA